MGPGHVQLSRDFHSSEIPGWEVYSPEVRARVADLVTGFLQPMRRRWGVIVITSGWRAEGTHSEGALDWVPVQALRDGHSLQKVGEWAGTYLPSQFGETIIEPAPYGGNVTGHIHTTPRGVGTPRNGVVMIEVGLDRFELGGAPAGMLLLMLAAWALVAIPGGFFGG